MTPENPGPELDIPVTLRAGVTRHFTRFSVVVVSHVYREKVRWKRLLDDSPERLAVLAGLARRTGGRKRRARA